MLTARQCAGFCHASSVGPQTAALQQRPLAPVQATRRVIAREYDFREVEGVVRERLEGRNCLLVAETTQLIECIKTPEHAARCLDIIQRYVAQKQALLTAEEVTDGPLAAAAAPQPAQPATAQPSASDADDLGVFMADWHHRKRFLSRIAEIAVMELNKPELLYAIVGNWSRFKLSTYFGKDIIKQLGRYDNVPLEVLTQVASLVQQQRGPAHKATRGAMLALLDVMQDRGAGDETMNKVKKAMADARRAQAQAQAPLSARPKVAVASPSPALA